MNKFKVVLRIFFPFILNLLIIRNNSAIANGSILDVPKTSIVPLIDGKLDQVWHNAANTRMLKYIYTQPTNWYDLTGSFRLMWDHENIYIYVHVIDQKPHIKFLGL